MDLRRHATIDKFYFGLTEDTKGEIEWYVAPVGAEWFTEPTPMRSLDAWDRFPPEPKRPGMIPWERGRYSKGATIPGYTGKGHRCGSLEWFRTGIPGGSSLPPNPARDPNGVPSCCKEGFGALALSGTSSVSFRSPSVPFRFRQLSTSILPGVGLSNIWRTPPLAGATMFVWVTAWFSDPNRATAFLPGYTQFLRLQSGNYVSWALVAINWTEFVSGPDFHGLYQGPFINFAPVFPDYGIAWSAEIQGADRIAPVRIVDGRVGNGPIVHVGPDQVLANPAELVIFQAGGGGPFTNTGNLVSANLVWLVSTIQNIGNPISVSFDTGNPSSIPWTAAIISFGGTPAPQQSRVVMSGQGAASFLYPPVSPGAFAMSGEGFDNLEGASEVAGAFAMSGEGFDNLEGASEVAGAFAMSGTSSDNLVGAGEGSGAFAMSGTSSDNLVGAGEGLGAFAMSGTSSDNLVGDGLPSLVQAPTGSTGTTTVALTWNVATTAGNHLEVAVLATSTTATPTITPPAGWTLARSATGTRSRVSIYYAQGAASQSGSGTFTVAGGAGLECAIVGMEWKGLLSSGSLESNNGIAGGVSTTPQAGTSAAWSQALVVGVAAVGQTSNAVFSAPANGYSIAQQVTTASNATLGILYKKLSATGSNSTSVTSGVNAQYVGAIVGFKE